MTFVMEPADKKFESHHWVGKSCALSWIVWVCCVYSPILDIGQARSHVKYPTLGKSPSDNNASSLPLFEGWFRLFCYTNVFGW